MAKRMSIGRVEFSAEYHRSRPRYPLWAACQRRLLYERASPDEARLLEERGLKPCPKCWPPVPEGVIVRVDGRATARSKGG
jgi:hypothetical protein